MTRRLAPFTFIVVVTCLGICGCSGGAKRPPLAKVKGVLTYKNAPVSNAVISFAKEGSPRMSSGITDAKGSFKLTTYDTNDGAFLGTQKVIVNLVEMNPSGEGSAPMTPESLGKIVGEGKFNEFIKKNKKASEIPTKYTNIKTTPLQFTIDAGDNEKNIELED